MPTKPWPSRLKKKDSKPKAYQDLSVEVQRVVAASSEEIYFFVYCWDMAWEKQTSVLFRARQFDRPADRLAAIDSEIVDACWSNGRLLALENGLNIRGGIGVVHELVGDFTKPKKSTRLKRGHVFKALGQTGDHLYAVGDTIQWFDGKAWKQTATLLSHQMINSVAGNKTLAVAVGKGNATSTNIDVVVRLDNGEPKPVSTPNLRHDTGYRVYVSRSGEVSLAGRGGKCFQGSLDKLVELEAPIGAGFTDCCEFQGTYYWSAHGDWSESEKKRGLFVQRGKKLVNVFDDAECFQLTATDRYLYASAADDDALVLRFDGMQWDSLKVKYDTRNEVWSAVPVRKKK